MEASLDTNVIIHLYKAKLQSVLFNRFQKLKVYEFIRNHEMTNHAEPEIIDLFDKDVETGRMELITDEYLKSIGMYQVFLHHVKDLRILLSRGFFVIGRDTKLSDLMYHGVSLEALMPVTQQLQ